MRVLLIDSNTKEFPAYLEKMATVGEPLELLYTDTIEAGIKQIKKGGIRLVLLAKSLVGFLKQIENIDPAMKIIAISGPKDKAFSKLGRLNAQPL